MSKKDDTLACAIGYWFATALLTIPGAMLISRYPLRRPFTNRFILSELDLTWKRLRCFPLPLNGAPYLDFPTVHGRP